MKCNNCGKDTSSNFDNCQHCGKKVANHPLPRRDYTNIEVTKRPFKSKDNKPK